MMDASMLTLVLEASDDSGFEAIEHLGTFSDGSSESIVPIISSYSTNCPKELFNHRIEGFYRNDIPRYNDPTFKAHFRMERTTFQLLCEEFCCDLQSRVVDQECKLLSVIWLLATEESYRGVADRFGMSKGSLHFTAMQVVEVISQKISKFVTWPTENKMKVMANDNQMKYSLPGIYGFIDGTHIPIKGRTANREAFINRLGYSSILLQAVCDSTSKFIHTYVGWPGSIHDARMFRNSDLNDILEPVPKDLHILGDSAFGLSLGLLTPYRDNGKLSTLQKRFNFLHGSARSVIERCFALLKGKFRRLKYLDMSLDDKIPLTVSSCVVLHNFILLNEKNPEPQCDLSDAGEIVPAVSEFGNDPSKKRDLIAASL